MRPRTLRASDVHYEAVEAERLNEMDSKTAQLPRRRYRNSLGTAGEVARFLASTARLVRRGRMTEKRGAVLAAICKILLVALEQGDGAAKLEAVERHLREVEAATRAARAS